MEEDEKLRRQWDEGAESWTRFVRSGKNYYSEFMNRPAFLRVVGDASGKKLLDIGCGEGHLSRFFAENGAEVTAVDFSEALIEMASEEDRERPLGINYIAADAANLGMLESESFDLVCCFMALMDIADYRGAIAEASRVLKPGGRFVIAITHPCFSTRLKDGEEVAGWVKRMGEDGSHEYLYYRIDDYFQRYGFEWEWKHDRIPSSFVTTGFHRTLSDYVNALTGNRLFVTRLEEPQPQEEGVRLLPSMQKHNRIPQSLVIEAIKIVTQSRGFKASSGKGDP